MWFNFQIDVENLPIAKIQKYGFTFVTFNYRSKVIYKRLFLESDFLKLRKLGYPEVLLIDTINGTFHNYKNVDKKSIK